MAKYKYPTKEEFERELIMTAQELDRLMDRLDRMKVSIDAYTDSDLTATAPSGLGFSTAQKDSIRSLAVGWKNLQLRYDNQAPLNSDSPVFINQQFLTMLRVF